MPSSVWIKTPLFKLTHIIKTDILEQQVEFYFQQNINIISKL